MASQVTLASRDVAAAPGLVSPSDRDLNRITAALAATAEQYDRSGEFPRANFDLLARENLIGLTVDRNLGGGGGGYVEAIRLLGAVAKGEPSTALILFMTYAFHAAPEKTERWPRALYEQLAREAVAGRGLIGTFRVEPELGTPVRGGLPKTVARRTAEGWRISGEKIYSTGSTGLDWFAVWARTDDGEPLVGSFLVAPGTPGITIEPEWDHLGMRATVSHKVVFDDVLTPIGHAVDVRRPEEWAPRPGSGEGSRQALWNALAIAAIYDGVARSARDWLARYLNERVPTNLGAALATLPRVQEKFGEIEARLYANRVLIDNAAAAADRGELPSPAEANLIKHIANANAIEAVAIGLELTGNPGISRRNPLERHYRDVLCSRIHSPQADTVLVAAGRAGLGN
ncbi:alkylation response protein AidB-like acyl-CoA dehydrogenase [Novosphingobium sp. PhB165]|uniref:acyl-CoA dehydrogenase family protein n=1 Tax=Novosphingobium sp. PhB165 TaxID=2485105 RepID=UPI001046891C|nr:acyl-CoA dehydrogenase family protein [Novosphingobium sp. PhB165]TCM14200.1 alkylation response protein AidB-like acyl-CoA dehydrogenase [Novosphingobium sp. PhB165]